MSIFICDVCSKEFSNKQSLGGHKSAAHKNKPRYSVKRKITKKDKDLKYFCQYCNRETTNPGANKKHEKTCQENPDPTKYKYHNKGGKKGIPACNIGLTKETSEIIAKSAKENSVKFTGKNNPFYGKKHTEETKLKISESRKKFIQENPHMSPWVYSHYTKRRSYAERYWKRVFNTYGVKFEEQYPVSLYCLDFAILEAKIDVEIDGEQHYYDQRIVDSDKRRNEYLENLGWKIIRIRWSEYKKLINKQDRKRYVKKIIEEIHAPVA
jgi:very-short-patch-repair endonuclease